MTSLDIACLLPLDAGVYEPHPMHGSERIWTETNCYVDVWVEVLHALGHNPIPAAASVFSSGFENGQWMFLKFSPEDLRRLYGIDVAEMNVWKPVLDHIVDNLRAGVLSTVEVDSFWLPDTVGTSYRNAHVKSTIVPNLVDLSGERMGYFHGAGYYEVSGADFRALFHLDGAAPEVLPPYFERVRFAETTSPAVGGADLDVARAHSSRRPVTNPVAALGDQVRTDLDWLGSAGVDGFHAWSFGLVRQCGAAAELAADVAGYLDGRGATGATAAAEHFRGVATGMKTLQFRLARAAHGRTVEIDPILEQAAADWSRAFDALAIAL